MKTRESGMPPEDMWRRFFDPVSVLGKLGWTPQCECVVDFGCGYGTFSIPASKLIRGKVYAFDIDREMIAATVQKAAAHSNVEVQLRDFVESGSGLASGVADYVMLFNILHAAEAPALLAEARRILREGGKLAVMHWNYDPSTPRGPSMEIRLRPEACMALARAAGFAVGDLVDLPPYHYGFIAQR